MAAPRLDCQPAHLGRHSVSAGSFVVWQPLGLTSPRSSYPAECRRRRLSVTETRRDVNRITECPIRARAQPLARAIEANPIFSIVPGGPQHYVYPDAAILPYDESRAGFVRGACQKRQLFQNPAFLLASVSLDLEGPLMRWKAPAKLDREILEKLGAAEGISQLRVILAIQPNNRPHWRRTWDRPECKPSPRPASSAGR
jgi:hypothetical protein